MGIQKSDSIIKLRIQNCEVRIFKAEFSIRLRVKSYTKEESPLIHPERIQRMREESKDLAQLCSMMTASKSVTNDKLAEPT